MSCSVFIAAALLAPAGIASSTEPLEGTWDLDQEQTTFTAGGPLQDQTLSIQKEDSNFTYTVTAAGAAGPQIIIKYTVPVRGGEGKFLIGNYDRVFHKRVDANTREARYFRDGKEVMRFRGTVTNGGRELRITVRGVDAKGRSIAGLSVYRRRQRCD